MLKIENTEVFGWEAATPIRGHPGFRCTTSGEIIGKRGKPMVGRVDRCGYKEVLLSENGKTKNYLAHRLILYTFKPTDTPSEYDVNHINGDKLDNRLENLEWCTRSENVKHAYDTGLAYRQVGHLNHNHKLTEVDVAYIKRVYVKRNRDYGAVALSRRFGVDRTTIHDIVRGKTWREVNAEN